MAVAAPSRRTAPAPRPSRTRPPAKPAPARPAPRSRAVVRPAPARRASARAPRRRLTNGGQLIPLAVGRTAVAVSQLPDSGLVVRMTRGRAWIAVLGMLLAGIVALNVITLSFAASSGKIGEQITTLSKENSLLGGRVAQRYGTARIRYEAGAQGLYMPNTEDPTLIEAGRDDAARAAARLAAAGG